MYAPQWATWIEQVIDWPGYADGVWWLHAHTKGDDWTVDAELRERVTAQVAKRTALDAADLVRGAVDVAWFHEVVQALGQERFTTAALGREVRLDLGSTQASRAVRRGPAGPGRPRRPARADPRQASPGLGARPRPAAPARPGGPARRRGAAALRAAHRLRGDRPHERLPTTGLGGDGRRGGAGEPGPHRWVRRPATDALGHGGARGARPRRRPGVGDLGRPGSHPGDQRHRCTRADRRTRRARAGVGAESCRQGPRRRRAAHQGHDAARPGPADAPVPGAGLCRRGALHPPRPQRDARPPAAAADAARPGARR